VLVLFPYPCKLERIYGLKLMLNIIYDIFNLPAFVIRLLNKNKNIVILEKES